MNPVEGKPQRILSVVVRFIRPYFLIDVYIPRKRMRNIKTFTFVSADGFYAGPKGEIDWFKVIEKDDEYDAFTQEGSRSKSILMFGHTTYEMMKSYWPTPEAMKNDRDMAEVVNYSRKIVFSRSLSDVQEEPQWKNITLFREIMPEEILDLKQRASTDITILGSGLIIQQLANLGLIDEYRLVILPVILGAGRYLFNNLKKTNLKLLESRSFKNGILSPLYIPIN